MEAKTGKHNREDIADTVPGGDHPARCAAAKIPEKDRVFKTKTQLALELVRTQRARGVRRRQIDIDSKKRRNPPILEDDL